MSTTTSTQLISTGKQTFLNWVNKIETEKHITHGNATHIKNKFNDTFTHVTNQSFKSCKKDFFKWIDRISKEKHITDGNAQYIKNKVKSSFKYVGTSSSTHTSLEDKKKKFLKKIENDKNVTPGNARHAKRKLDDLFSTSQTNYSGPVRNFEGWVDRAVKDGNITGPAAKKIKKTIETVFVSQQNTTSTTQTHGSSSVRLQQIAQANGYVHFYLHGLTALFGNFHEINGGITYKGLTYRCVEAAFQAQKYPGHEREFTKLDGDQAFIHKKKLDAQGKRRHGWDTIKVDVMKDLIRLKFSSNPFKSMLLNTGTAYLVEHNSKKGRDTEWSDDTDGTGKNLLGQILMIVRGELGGTGVVRPAAQYFSDLQKHRNAIPAIS